MTIQKLMYQQLKTELDRCTQNTRLSFATPEELYKVAEMLTELSVDQAEAEIRIKQYVKNIKKITKES